MVEYMNIHTVSMGLYHLPTEVEMICDWFSCLAHFRTGLRVHVPNPGVSLGKPNERYAGVIKRSQG